MSILNDEQMQDYKDLCKAQSRECAVKTTEEYLLRRLKSKGLREDEQQVLLEAMRKELASI